LTRPAAPRSSSHQVRADARRRADSPPNDEETPQEAITVVEHAVREQGITPGTLTLGTDNGSAYTARRFRQVLSGLGVVHRRGGYRDPESQAFIESWFSKLKERCIWRNEFETIQDARTAIAAYVERYHDRPHEGLNYRTPKEVRKTWDDAQEQPLKLAA
jgi:putative transposase